MTLKKLIINGRQILQWILEEKNTQPQDLKQCLEIKVALSVGSMKLCMQVVKQIEKILYK